MSNNTEFTDPIEQVILEEFPYPVALAYHQMLKAKSPEERAELGKRIFYFSIRAISFAIIIQYLKASPKLVNDTVLNETIENYFIAPRTQHWIELLQKGLHAFRETQEKFFITELSDIPTDDTSDAYPALWNLLNDIARISNTLDDDPGSRAMYANEMSVKLREVLKHFEFMRNYELWYIRHRDAKRFKAEVFRGREKAFRYISIAEARTREGTRINDKRFYLRKRKEDGYYLLELHPLILNADAIQEWQETVLDGIESGSSTGDTAVYHTFLDKGTSDPQDDELVYRLLHSNQSRSVGGDLVALFLELERRLDERRRVFSSKFPLSETSLHEASVIYSSDQIRTAQGKYIGQAYVERQDLNRVVRAFLVADEPILLISGNVGVGKTSLLVHHYQETFINQPQLLTLWFDGSLLDTRQGLANTVLEAWDRAVDFDSIPQDDKAANRLLRNILERYLPQRQLLLVFDGVNENNRPIEAFGAINDFVLEFQPTDRIKIIVTTRPQVWHYTRTKYLRARFKPFNYFHTMPTESDLTTFTVEHYSFVLNRYRQDEFVQAFEKYTRFYQLLNPDSRRLTPSLRKAIHEPLFLRLTCEAFQGKQIPENLQADKVIPSLIDRLIEEPNIALYKEDFDFLTRWIVPQFLPPGGIPLAKLTRSQLSTVLVTENRTLDDLVSDTTEFVNRTSVNDRAQRLMNTGWLVRTGSSRNYELSFRYEYFYDYFVGGYLLEQYKQAEEKSGFVANLVGEIHRVPFLWGATRNLLVDLIREERYDQILELGRTKDVIQYSLLVSVLSENYPRDKGFSSPLHDILLRWLEVEEEECLASHIATNVSIACGIEAILQQLLKDSRDDVRLLVIQRIYELWTNYPEITKSLLTNLSSHLNILRPRQSMDSLDVLLRCSLLLVMEDYHKQKADKRVALMVQNLWHPLINRVFLVSPIRLIERIMVRVRRRLLRFGIRRTSQLIRTLEENEMVVFSTEDLESSFPTDEYRRKVLNRLIQHLDAATGKSVETADDLVNYISELDRSGDNDFLTAIFVWIVLVAHFVNDPLGTCTASHRLLNEFKSRKNPTLDPNEPTASIWVPIVCMSMDILTMRNLSRMEAKPVIELFSDMVLIKETHFLCSWVLGRSNKNQRLTSTGDILIAYTTGQPELGYEVLKTIFEFHIARLDHEMIRRSVSHLADTTSFLDVPEIGVTAIYDALQIVKPYLNGLDTNHVDKFWNSLSENLIRYMGNYKDHLAAFVEMFEDEELPQSVRTSILHAAPRAQAEFGRQLGTAGVLFGNRALKAEDPFIREQIVKWAMSKALEVDDLHGLLYEGLVYLAELTYGGHLFTS
jgi:hypothetical protein